MKNIIILFIFLFTGNIFSQEKNAPVKNSKELPAVSQKDLNARVEELEKLLKIYMDKQNKEINKQDSGGTNYLEEMKSKFIIGGFLDVQYGKSYPNNLHKNSLENKLKLNQNVANENTLYPIFNANPAFKIANINLYNTFNITDSWKAFTEFRLLFAPSGNRTSSDIHILEGTPINQNGQPIIYFLLVMESLSGKRVDKFLENFFFQKILL